MTMSINTDMQVVARKFRGNVLNSRISPWLYEQNQKSSDMTHSPENAHSSKPSKNNLTELLARTTPPYNHLHQWMSNQHQCLATSRCPSTLTSFRIPLRSNISPRSNSMLGKQTVVEGEIYPWIAVRGKSQCITEDKQHLHLKRNRGWVYGFISKLSA